jgi:hypothetical protein
VTSKRHSAAESLTSLVGTMDSAGNLKMAQAKLRRGLRGEGRAEAHS